MSCDRKNYSVDLEGSAPAYFRPDFSDDKFLLISMCKDDGYLNQYTINRILTKLGLFELKSKMVELKLNGVSKGIYLVLEKHQSEFRNNKMRIRSILRRRTDSKHPDDTKPYLRHTRIGNKNTLASYQELFKISKTYHGQELVDQLKARMDLHQYLKWVAVLSLFRSKDYIDEIWFISEETTLPNGKPADFFKFHAWDQDQLFSSCHHSGRLAIQDPNELLYCTESVFDHAIFADPTIYALYVDILESVLAEVGAQEVKEALSLTQKALTSLLKRETARDASFELYEPGQEVPTYEESLHTVKQNVMSFQTKFELNWEFLRKKIRIYRQASVNAAKAG